jgi:radical SAM protein with 4Fe4S-binding SPASM domain
MHNRQRYFGIVNTLKISFLKTYNSCLYGKIAININGDVLLCPMMREIKLGNIKGTTLNKVLRNSKYDEYININKDSISKCSMCSFRYNCTDCRAIEMSATNDLVGLEYCNYK